MDNILFLTKANAAETPSQDMTYHLAEVRKSVNRSFFMSLDSKQIKTVYNFLWKTLDSIYKVGQPHVRIAASTTLGEILMTLGPYFHVNLMKSLQDAIAFSTSESILLLSCFCYLSKFFNEEQNYQILSETPIFHLFGVDESDHLVPLVDGLMHLPKDFLLTLAEYLFMLAQKYLNNRHFMRAAAKLFNVDQTRFSDIVSASTPLSLLAGMYPKKLPVLPDDKREKLIEKCLSNLRNNVKAPEIDYTCVVLNSLHKSDQISAERINECVNEDLLRNTQSLSSILSLPINPEIVQCLFTWDTNAATDVGKFRADYAKIPMLINFFAERRIFKDQLLFLMSSALDPDKETYSNAIDAIPSLANIEDKEVFHSLLLKALDNVERNNWIQQFWLLQMLKKIDFTEMPLEVCQKVFVAIECSSVSKSEKLQKAAKDIIVEISKTMEPISYRLFIDIYTRKIDFFDSETFEQRLSFIAYVFDKIPDGYQVSFLGVAYFLYETISIFEFTPQALSNAFVTVASLIKYVHDSEITLFFVKHAASIIDVSFNEFTGEIVYPQKTPLFCGVTHKDVIKLNDIDILQNPTVWHSQFLGCALSALKFLSSVQWNEVRLQNDDIAYLFALARSMLSFFPVESCNLAQSLLILHSIPTKILTDFSLSSLALVNGFDSMASLASFLAVANRKLNFAVTSLSLADFTTDLVTKLKSASSIRPCFADGLALFCELTGNKVTKEEIDAKINKTEIPIHKEIEANNVAAPEEKKEEVVEDVQEDNKIHDSTKELTKDPKHLRNFICSITPFIIDGGSVPEELESPSMYTLYLMNSGFPPTTKLLQHILDYAVEHKARRLLEQVYIYCTKHKAELNVEKHIGSDFFDDETIFPIAVSLLHVNKKKDQENCKLFIEKHVKEAELFDFIINAESFDKATALSLVRYDPSQFINSFAKLTKIRYIHISKLCSYMRKVQFPGEELFSLVFRIVSSSRKARKKKFLSLRLLAVFIAKYGTLSQPSISAAAEIVKNILDENETNPAVLNELCYIIAALSDVASIKQIASRLSLIMPPSTPCGSLLSYLNATSITSEMIQTSLASDFKSINNHPYIFVLDKTKIPQVKDTDVGGIPDEFTKLLFVPRKVQTPVMEFLLIRCIDAACKHGLSHSRFRMIFSFIMECMNVAPNASIVQPLVILFKRMAVMLKIKSHKLDLIFHYAESLFSVIMVDANTVELLIQSAIKKGVYNEAEAVLDKYMQDNSNSASLYVAAEISFANYKHNPANKDVFKFLPPTDVFMHIFVSIALIEKKDKSVNHKLYETKVLNKAHRKAIQLLLDPNNRKYSTLLAFYPKDDFPIESLPIM